MKKVFYLISAMIMLCMMSVVGYAEGEITISRVEVVDYVLLLGLGVFLVGMIIILLTMFVKPSNKKVDDEEYDDDYDEAYDEEEYENTAEADDITTDTDNEPEEVEIEETEIEEVSEAEEESVVEDEPEEVVADMSEEEADSEAVVEPESEPETVIGEEPEPEKIRITFFGLNNPDVRAFEMTDRLTLGRRKGNDMVIEDGAVSGNHCEIVVENDRVFIADLDSTNGTYVNDEPVVRCELNSGDSLILGKNKYRINIS